jgi:hypothetical protein
LLPLEILEKLTPKPRLTALPAQRSQITGFNGEKFLVVGECELTVAVPLKHVTVRFLVVDAPCSCILGIDFIDGQDVQFDRDMNYVWCRSGIVQPPQEEDSDQQAAVVAVQGQQAIPSRSEYCLRVRSHG